MFAKKTAVDIFFANFRKFRETSEIEFDRHFSMKVSPQGSGERGKRPEIVFFAAVFSQTPGTGTEDYKEGDELMRLPCLHLFHAQLGRPKSPPTKDNEKYNMHDAKVRELLVFANKNGGRQLFLQFFANFGKPRKSISIDIFL